MNAEKHTFSIKGSAGRPITGDYFFVRDGRKKPVVIFVHGFKGYKDWGHFNRLGEIFAENSFVFVKFNFSFNGTTPDRQDTTHDTEAFGNNNYIIELDDLGLVIDWVSAQLPPTEADTTEVYLIGHSRGGGISILKAGEDQRVKKIVTWASVCDLFNRNSKETIARWKKEGVIHTTNARTGQKLPLYYQFHETILQNRNRLDIEAAARRLSIPFLIVHAEDDEAVPVREAQQLHKWSKHSKLLVSETGGHTFDVRHPFEGKELPPAAENVINKTIQFLNERG